MPVGRPNADRLEGRTLVPKVEKKKRSGKSMPPLRHTSNYLTKKYLPTILNKLKLARVNIEGNKLRGIRLFSSARGQNVVQIVFLNLNLPNILTETLAGYGIKLRSEFTAANSHAHSTLLSDNEFGMLDEDQKAMVRALTQIIVEVNIKIIIALSNENDVCLGLEIEVLGSAEFRRRFEYDPIFCPHITTSHMWKIIYHQVLEPTVFKYTGRVDKWTRLVRTRQSTGSWW